MRRLTIAHLHANADCYLLALSVGEEQIHPCALLSTSHTHQSTQTAHDLVSLKKDDQGFFLVQP